MKISAENSWSDQGEIITGLDRFMFKSRPCPSEHLRLGRVYLDRIKSIEYSPRDDALIIFDFNQSNGGYLFKVDLQTEDYWTSLVAGTPTHCQPTQNDVTPISKFNSIRTSPSGGIFASTSNQIFEISNGTIIPIFGACGLNCAQIPSNSAARLVNLIKFDFDQSDARKIRIIERENGSTSVHKVGLLQPIAAKKTNVGYEIGFPKENLIRIYLADGRLVQIKDIFTRKTLKYFKYGTSNLQSVKDQFENEIKFSYFKGRILIQNSANQRRAQITLNLQTGYPMEVEDEDGKTSFEYDTSDSNKLKRIDGTFFTWNEDRVTKVVTNNLTQYKSTGSVRDNRWTVTTGCDTQTVTWSSGDFYFSSRSADQITFLTGDGSHVTSYLTIDQSKAAYNMTINSLDPITERPIGYGEIINRGDLIPSKETAWISTNDRSASYVRRILKSGNTMMSYELDYSASNGPINGKFYDETVNLIGQLTFDKSTGRMTKINVQYQKNSPSDRNIYQKRFKYSSSGLITEISSTSPSSTSSVVFSRTRAGRLTSITTNGMATWRVKISKDIKITAPDGSDYTIGYGKRDGNNLEVSILYPTGTKFTVQTSLDGNKVYKRNGIKFHKIEETSKYLQVTRFEGDKESKSVSLKKCDGQLLKAAGASNREFIYDDFGKLVGVSYDVTEYRSYYFGDIKTSDEGSNYKVSYFYDSNHRSTETQISVFGRHMTRSWSYDKDEPIKIDDFDFVELSGAIYQISNPRTKLFRKYDPRDQTKSIKRTIISQLVVNDQVICEANYESSTGGRQIENFQISIEGRSPEPKKLERKFDAKGVIIETERERMSYEGNKLRKITLDGNKDFIIGRDHVDRIIKFGAIRLKYDQNGLISIGDDIQLTWDLNDQLTSYNGQVVHYDHQNRIVQFGDIKIAYANVQFPNRPTHFISRMRIQHLYYDLSGALYSIKEDIFGGSTNQITKTYFIVAQSDSTPMFVFDENGDLVKQIERSYYGRITRDTNPEFDLLVGHRGDICVGAYLCRDKLTNRWRQILTNEDVSFGLERFQLDTLLQTADPSADSDLTFDLFSNDLKWPFRNREKFSMIFSKREKLIETFLKTLNTLGTSSCDNIITCNMEM